MNKPASMTMKEWLIKKMAIQLVISEKIIEAVINHQFDSAFCATKDHNSIEISGFGKFVFNEKRAAKQMQKYNTLVEMYTKTLNREDSSEAVKRNMTMRLATLADNITALTPKLNKDGLS